MHGRNVYFKKGENFTYLPATSEKIMELTHLDNVHSSPFF